MLGKMMRERRYKKEVADLIDLIARACRRDLGQPSTCEIVSSSDAAAGDTELKLETPAGSVDGRLSHSDKGWTLHLTGADWSATIFPHQGLHNAVPPIIAGSFGERARARALFQKFRELTPFYIDIEEHPIDERIWPDMVSLGFTRRFTGARGGKLTVSIEVDRSLPDSPNFRLEAACGKRGDLISSQWVADPRHLVALAERFEMMAIEPDPTEKMVY